MGLAEPLAALATIGAERAPRAGITSYTQGEPVRAPQFSCTTATSAAHALSSRPVR